MYGTRPSPASANSWTLATDSAPWGVSYSLDAVTAIATVSDRILVLANGLYISDVGVTSWSLVSATPAFGLRTGAVFGQVLDKIYLLAGVSGGVYQQDAWVSSDEGTTWGLIAAAAGYSPRTYPSVYVNGNSLVLSNGKRSDGTFLGDVWVATMPSFMTQVNSNMWSSTGGGAPTWEAAAFQFQNKLFYEMGHFANCQASSNVGVSVDNGATWSWSAASGLAHVPFKLRYGSVAEPAGSGRWKSVFRWLVQHRLVQ